MSSPPRPDDDRPAPGDGRGGVGHPRRGPDGSGLAALRMDKTYWVVRKGGCVIDCSD